jgi:hypothetical protein
MSEATLGALCRQQLRAVAAGLALPDARRLQLERFVDGLAAVVPLDDTPLDRPPRWSAIGDDASPFEWSFVPGRAADVRLLVEAQADPPSPASYWDEARRLTAWCVERLGASTTRLDRVADLFAPTDPQAYQACWHGFDFPGASADGPVPPRVKVYLNPAAGGRAGAPDVVREALSRLGFRAALDTLAPVVEGHPIVHCSLDLADGPGARVKLYARVRSRDDMHALYRLGRSAHGGDVGWLCEVLGIPDPWPRTGFCVLHLTDADDPRPARSVVNLPVADLMGPDDHVEERLAALLVDRGVDAAPYRAVLAALRATDPTRDALPSGRHSYLSFQRQDGMSRLTVYLGARAYLLKYGRLSVDPARWWPSPVDGDGHGFEDQRVRPPVTTDT